MYRLLRLILSHCIQIKSKIRPFFPPISLLCYFVCSIYSAPNTQYYSTLTSLHFVRLTLGMFSKVTYIYNQCKQLSPYGKREKEQFVQSNQRWEEVGLRRLIKARWINCFPNLIYDKDSISGLDFSVMLRCTYTKLRRGNISDSDSCS